MYDLLSLRPQITRVIIKREKKIVVTTNRAVYIIAFDWIVFAQNLDDSFEFQCSLVRCCARTPLIRKSCFLTTATGFNALQNIPVINARFWHVLASTTFVNESFKYSEIRTNSDVVGGTLQKKFFPAFPRGLKNTSYFAFWQQQQSSDRIPDWFTHEQWIRVEWQTVHRPVFWLD